MNRGYVMTAFAVSLLATTASAQYAAGGNVTPYCREFTQKSVVAGKPQTTYGTTCMQPDGSWQIMPPDSQDPNAAPPQPQAYAPPPAYPAPYPAPYPVAVPAYYPAYAAPYPYYAPGPYIGLDIGHSWYHNGDRGWHR